MSSSLCEQGNDDVYLCIKYGDSVSVSAAFVSGQTYPEDQSQVRFILDPTYICNRFIGASSLKPGDVHKNH